MKKILQNKFLLKSIQVFLVCWVVLGGGLGGGEDIQAAVCSPYTGNCDGSADGSCEADLLTDANNCEHCGIACNGICVGGECKSVKGGLVPCGRISDNCDTAWDERADCNLCHLIIMTKEIVDFLIEIAAVITAFFIVAGGLLYIFASGDPGKVTLAKKSITLALGGFTLVFIGWIMIDTVLVAFGYVDPLDPGGKWNEVNCSVPMAECEDPLCGNKHWDDGEECDRTETQENFCKRKLGQASCNQDDLNSVASDWVEMKGSCSFGCTYKCVGIEDSDKIGEGCYEPIRGTGSRCQKGKYTCDVDSNIVQCIDIFSDPDYSWDPQYAGKQVYDYCCSFMEGEITKTDARTDITNLGATRIKYSAAWLDPAGTDHFHCDEVCKSAGKICVGVGLTDDIIADGCHGVTCHSGSNCTGNTGNLDCRLPFPFIRPGDHNKCTLCNGVACTYDGVNSPYYVGYSSCLCF